jgi:hypothetical protein
MAAEVSFDDLLTCPRCIDVEEDEPKVATALISTEDDSYVWVCPLHIDVDEQVIFQVAVPQLND